MEGECVGVLGRDCSCERRCLGAELGLQGYFRTLRGVGSPHALAWLLETKMVNDMSSRTVDEVDVVAMDEASKDHAGH